MYTYLQCTVSQTNDDKQHENRNGDKIQNSRTTIEQYHNGNNVLSRQG